MSSDKRKADRRRWDTLIRVSEAAGFPGGLVAVPGNREHWLDEMESLLASGHFVLKRAGQVKDKRNYVILTPKGAALLRRLSKSHGTVSPRRQASLARSIAGRIYEPSSLRRCGARIRD